MSERFWSKVDKTATCWLWTAGKNSGGYGVTYASGRAMVAHRWAYESEVGPIPAGLQLDHLCRVRHCVNPAHLEPVTIRENVLRGVGLSAHNARKTHCPRGHEYDRQYRDGVRRCRKCANALELRRARQMRGMAA